jgi:Domain of unknown function (DUF4386)
MTTTVYSNRIQEDVSGACKKGAEKMNATNTTTGIGMELKQDAMNQAISSSSSSIPEAIGGGEALKKSVLTESRMTYSRLIGALFLLGFVSYGVGFALVTSVVGVPDFLSTISARQTILVLGAFLMLLNTPVDVAKAVLFFPILEKHSKRTALAYLATMIVEVVFLTIGVLALLMIVPLSQHAGEGWAKGLGSLVVQSNAMSYQIGEAALGFGALFLCSLLLRTRLIPRFLAISGLIGYAILMAGALAEIFGIHIGLILSIPGGLFELALGFWLLIKGFRLEVYGQDL